MKKFKISYLWLLMLLPLMGACSKEDIVFDVELPRFELRPGYQLLEVIVPQRTMPTDKIYIVGEFNGLSTINPWRIPNLRLSDRGRT